MCPYMYQRNLFVCHILVRTFHDFRYEYTIYTISKYLSLVVLYLLESLMSIMYLQCN